MDNVLIFLLIAGLVAGAGLVTIDFSERRTRIAAEEAASRAESGATPTPGNPETLPRGTQTETRQVKPDYEQPTSGEISSEVKSLDFKVDLDTAEADVTTRFRIRNPGSEEEDLRIDSVQEDGSRMSLILRQGAREGWIKDYASGEWTHLTGPGYTRIWGTRSDQYLAYGVRSWIEMEGNSYTIETEDGTGRIYDIEVNEGIPDSVFSPE